LVQSTVNRGETIQLRIRLRNDTDQAVRLPQEYRLVDGTLLLQVRYGDEVLDMPLVQTAAVQFATELQPGEEREYLVALTGDEGFKFDSRGRYEIKVLRLFGVWVPVEQSVCFVNVR